MRACRKKGRLTPHFRLLLLLLLLFTTVAAELSAASLISRYQPIFKPFYGENGALLAAVRRFSRGTEDRVLILDPQGLTMREMPAQKILSARTAEDETWRETPFSRALARQTSPPYPLQNDGLRESEHPVSGVFLTADLCPAKKSLDYRLFEATMALPQKPPVPVALMVSGLWMRGHQADLAWLKDQEATGRLAITWVNHSLTHPYDPAAPLERNFLLSSKTHFTSEVLSLEMLLLEYGLTPSPFFRFPGLVSNRTLIEELRTLSLIPIGSNAWLAKGELPKPGSIILVHANGNEPEGIRLLISFYDEHRDSLRRGDMTLLPLSQALRLSEGPR